MNPASELRAIKDLRFAIAHVDSICDVLESGALAHLSDVDSATLARSMKTLAKVSAVTGTLAWKLTQRTTLTDADRLDG
jgi:hypothetical protein